MLVDRRPHHKALLQNLTTELAGNTQPLRVKKKTASNLFRYDERAKHRGRKVDLGAFNQPLYIDTKNQTLDVQGLATFKSIVDFVLPHGFTPVITPELKHITVGGALVGVGIETNTYRYGFVHDNLLEADVLLPSGDVVLATPNNKHADLFHALANSYGTLGYILRARIKLHKTLPYVHLETRRYQNIDDLFKAMHEASNDPKLDYIESLAYSESELFLTTELQTEYSENLQTIYGPQPFYQMISGPSSFSLPIEEYLFRYDPDFFWGVPTSGLYGLFRHVAPRKLRNSGFYNRYTKFQAALSKRLPFIKVLDDDLEPLIQDWEVPWKDGKDLLAFALNNLDLDSKPLMSGPIKTLSKSSLYPMPPNKLYYNLGSYNFVKKKPGQPSYHNTKIMDRFCFSRGGIKMLYSSTFLGEAEFNKYYGGNQYIKLKAKYDSHDLLPTLYEKAVKAR